MIISTITSHLESIAHLSLQEPYDNAGLLTGDAGRECSGVLCTLDVTEEVVYEAMKKNCNCIVAHHPVIFRGLKKITGAGHVERTVIAAVKNDVAIYAAHTNLDNIITGVNGRIADKLGLQHRRVLSPTGVGTGSGMIGELGDFIPATAFLNLLQESFALQLIRHTGHQHAIRRVAICGGAGSFLISRALDEKADAFVTSDIRYHDFFETGPKMLLCDIGHYESEQYTTDLLIEILLLKFPTFAVLKSAVQTNPVVYFTGNNTKTGTTHG